MHGSNTEKIRERGHQHLDSYGQLGELPKPVIMGWIDQLIDQQILERVGDYRVLEIMPTGLDVLNSQADAKLLPPVQLPPRKKKPKRAKSKAGLPAASVGDDTPFSASDVILFERLRTLRREIADAKGVPAFMVFSDKTLHALARQRPTTRDEFLDVKGVGKAKCRLYAKRFLQVVAEA